MSSLSSDWQSGMLVHQAHKEVNLNELAAYAFTKAYPTTNNVKEIITTI